MQPLWSFAEKRGKEKEERGGGRGRKREEKEEGWEEGGTEGRRKEKGWRKEGREDVQFLAFQKINF